jgi:hypothetical protein
VWWCSSLTIRGESPPGVIGFPNRTGRIPETEPLYPVIISKGIPIFEWKLFPESNPGLGLSNGLSHVREIPHTPPSGGTNSKDAHPPRPTSTLDQVTTSLFSLQTPIISIKAMHRADLYIVETTSHARQYARTLTGLRHASILL